MTTVPDKRKEIQLTSGTIRYREAGRGKPIVFVHGFLVDGRLWEGVVDRLADRYRCLAPDWPLGAQQVAMNPDADLSPPGLARLIAEFIERLELEDVTVVGNDSGGAISQILAANHPERIGRQAFAPFARTKIPNDLIASWMRPATQDSGVMRDTKKVTAGMNKRHTLAAAKKLHTSDIPLRLLWAPGDKFFPIKYAERLAGEVPNSQIIQIPDAKTFVPLDQPQRVADEIADFVS